jgi:GTP-binding protein YchF
MKLGIVGLPGSGKTTIFEALTRHFTAGRHKEETRIGTIPVSDKRVDVLSAMYQPGKTIYAQVEYLLPGIKGHQKENAWVQVRNCDAMIHVVRNFTGYGREAPTPYEDFRKLDQELIFSDLVVTEKRLERLALDQRRGQKIHQEELSLLKESRELLENEKPLRKFADLASAPILKGYTFLSAKPVLVLMNNDDDDGFLPDSHEITPDEDYMVVRGGLEHELAQMSDEEAADFLTAFNISESVMDRVVKRSYECLGLISFFTVVHNEVRAWTIKKGTQAIEAAGVIHSDMQRGFIRAEVLSYADLMEAGSEKAARKKGTVRVEAKVYEVQDGDIINFRFNV